MQVLYPHRSFKAVNPAGRPKNTGTMVRKQCCFKYNVNIVYDVAYDSKPIYDVQWQVAGLGAMTERRKKWYPRRRRRTTKDSPKESAAKD